jgi:hypothetical protein
MEYSIFVNIIFLIGVFFLLHFIYLFIRSIQTKEWLSVEGKIYKCKSEVINQDIDDNMGVSHKGRLNINMLLKGRFIVLKGFLLAIIYEEIFLIM